MALVTLQPAAGGLCAVGVLAAATCSAGIATWTFLYGATKRTMPEIRLTRETLRVGPREWPLACVGVAIPERDCVRLVFVDGSWREIAHGRPADTRQALAHVIGELAGRARGIGSDADHERRLRSLRGRAVR